MYGIFVSESNFTTLFMTINYQKVGILVIVLTSTATFLVLLAGGFGIIAFFDILLQLSLITCRLFFEKGQTTFQSTD